MHFKFTSDNGLETIAKKSTNLYLTLRENRMTGKHNLELAISYKLTTGQRKTLKKTWGLDDLAPEPAIRSCDSGQRILCFGSCQLTIIWISYQVKHRLQAPTLFWQFTLVSLSFGRTDLWSRDYQIFLGMGSPLVELRYYAKTTIMFA